MSKRDGLYIIAVGGGVAIGFMGLVALFSLLTYSYDLYQKLSEIDRYQSEAKAGEHENGEPAAFPPALHTDLHPVPNAKEKQDATDEFTRRDVAAQEGMFYSAVAMAVVGVGQLGLSWWGILYIRRTLRMNTRATAAAVSGVREARKSRIDAGRQSRQQTRAYVCVESISYMASSTPTEDYFIVSAKNYGDTPALDVELHARAAILPGMSRPQTGFFDSQPHLTIEPGKARPFIKRTILAPSQSIDQSNRHRRLRAMLRVTRASRGTIYVYGGVYYRDIHGQRWRTRFCHIFQANKAPHEGFVPFEEGNYEDQALPPEVPIEVPAEPLAV